MRFIRDCERGSSFLRGLLTTNLALFSDLLQLPIPLGMDLLLTRGELLRRDVANRTVQANVVVMLDVALHQSPRIFQRQRRSGRMHSPLSDSRPYFSNPVCAANVCCRTRLLTETYTLSAQPVDRRVLQSSLD